MSANSEDLSSATTMLEHWKWKHPGAAKFTLDPVVGQNATGWFGGVGVSLHGPCVWLVGIPLFDLFISHPNVIYIKITKINC